MSAFERDRPELEAALQAAYEELEVAHEALRAQQEQTAALLRVYREGAQMRERLFAALPVPVLLTDRAGTVLQANGAAAGLLRRRLVDLLHRPLPTLVVAGEGRVVDEALASIGHEPRHVNLHVTVREEPVAVVAVVAAEPGEVERLRWLLLPAEGVPGAGERSAGEDTLKALASICRLPGAADLAAALTSASSLAHTALPEADAVSIHVGDPRSPEAQGSDSKLAQAFDYAELRAEQGPCVDAYARGEIVLVSDVLDGTRWPRLAQEAAGLGIRATLAVPIVVGEEVRGALNLFATRPDAFTAESAQLASLFGETVWALVEEVHEVQRLRALAGQLQTALSSRAVIEQAKGMVAVGLGCGVEDAFGVLRTVSQRSNRKLHDIARHVVEHAGEPLERVLAVPPRRT